MVHAVHWDSCIGETKRFHRNCFGYFGFLYPLQLVVQARLFTLKKCKKIVLVVFTFAYTQKLGLSAAIDAARCGRSAKKKTKQKPQKVMKLQGKTCRSGGAWAPPKAHQNRKKMPFTTRKNHVFPCSFIKSQAFSFVFFLNRTSQQAGGFLAFWVVETH